MDLKLSRKKTPKLLRLCHTVKIEKNPLWWKEKNHHIQTASSLLFDIGKILFLMQLPIGKKNTHLA